MHKALSVSSHTGPRSESSQRFPDRLWREMSGTHIIALKVGRIDKKRVDASAADSFVCLNNA